MAALVAGAQAANASRPATAPDGSLLAWLGSDTRGAQQRIYVRQRHEFQPRVLDTGAGRRRLIAFSPDGEWIAYSHAPDVGSSGVTEIRKIRVAGGWSERVAMVETVIAPGSALSWQAGHVWMTGSRELPGYADSGGAVRTVLAVKEDERVVGAVQAITLPATQEARGLQGVSPDALRVILGSASDSRVFSANGTGTPTEIEDRALFSPDGRWVVHRAGNVVGNIVVGPQELWVRPEPAASGTRWLVGQISGFGPFWSGDGRELI